MFNSMNFVINSVFINYPLTEGHLCNNPKTKDYIEKCKMKYVIVPSIWLHVLKPEL